MNEGFLYGLLVGAAIGWVARPLLRWWLTVLEWRSASREAEIAEELLRRIANEPEPGAAPGPEPHELRR